ncbi:phosphatidylserine decarboxylase [Parelusimicrobium proximum]|uniref:archaetidylserine decarboxylase n=1 Tax=Parelusimicrobium proximum TaxID=3228953 RepID=UPI003D179B4F
MASLGDTIKIKTQYLMPKKLISRAVGILAKANLGILTKLVIKLFITRYNVDMQDAVVQDIKQFKSFNDFFTRELKPATRPIEADSNAIIHPADGTISEFGIINKDLLLQAKNHPYSLNALLGGDAQDSQPFENGFYATTYLSPGDYHRFHMPCEGMLEKVIFIPGSLFSVNPLIAENVDNLFARNERAVCFFVNEKLGKFALVLVGAAIVSGISLMFTKETLSSKNGKVETFNYPPGEVFIKKGAELGKFYLGSTVISIFPQNKITPDSMLRSGSKVKMGTILGKILQ